MGRIEDMGTGTLIDRVHELSKHEKEPYLTEARRQQISREMGYIVFELESRLGHAIDTEL